MVWVATGLLTLLSAACGLVAWWWLMGLLHAEPAAPAPDPAPPHPWVRSIYDDLR